MVVLVRLLWALLKGSFKRRIGPLDAATIAMRVWPNDLDLNVHMNSGRYLSMMDVGRIELLVRMRILRKVIGLGWRPMVGATTIRYRRSLLPFERFTVTSRVLCWDEKWFYFEHVMARKDGPVATAYVRGLMRGPSGNVPPTDFVELAGGGGVASPPMPLLVREWLEALER